MTSTAPFDPLRDAKPATSRGSEATDITRFVVGAINTATGRGPTSARSHVSRDVISVVLGDTLTRLERTLCDGGHGETVRAGRAALHRLIEPQLIAGVESLTGAKVVSAHSDHRVETDTAVLTFVLCQPS